MVGGQDRTTGTFGGCLTRKHAVNAEFVGELYPCYDKQTKKTIWLTGNRYKIEILMSRTQKLKGLAAASLKLKTFDENH